MIKKIFYGTLIALFLFSVVVYGMAGVDSSNVETELTGRGCQDANMDVSGIQFSLRHLVMVRYTIKDCNIHKRAVWYLINVPRKAPDGMAKEGRFLLK